MKIKNVLLTIPAVAILASCSSKIDVYRDIFKEARNIDSSVREREYGELTTYLFNGSRTITVKRNSEEKTSFTEDIYVLYENVLSEGEKFQSVIYNINSESKLNIYTDQSGALCWNTCPDPSLDVSTTFNKFRSLPFSWVGNIQTGDFDTAPYEYDTKLLNAVSPKCSVRGGSVDDPDFEINMNSTAMYKDGKVSHVVSLYHVAYEDYKIQSYECVYEYRFDNINLSIQFSTSGTFNYDPVH